MTKEKMHQNAEERLELLHTISDIVGIEVEKRMHAFTDVEHFSVRDASMAKPASGPLTSEQDKKNPYINNLSPQSVRNKRRDTKKHFINMKKLLLLCALLVSVITLSGAANRSFRTEMEQWNPIGFTQASNGMTQSQAGSPITNRLTAGSAILPTVATAAPSGVLRSGSTNVITFTTAKAVGETVRLRMQYSGDKPTLTGLTGTPKNNGEEVTYKLTSQTVTITGYITFFSCEKNQLTALDVSRNTDLSSLNCPKNQLTALDVSKNTGLSELACYNNQLKALDVSKNTALKLLHCNNNQLAALDVSRNTALIRISCDNNQLKALDVSQNTTLRELYCDNNQLTALDVSKNTALERLDCYNNQLKALGVSKSTKLKTLRCYGNQIKGEEMTRLVKSLPYHTEWDAGRFFVVQEPALEGNICLKSDVAIAKGKNWYTYKYKSNTKGEDDYEGAEPSHNVITFKTAKAVGEKISLYMQYSGVAPTLSGATGTPESGGITYTLTSQTVTIRGDVTYLYCSDNQLTTLDVSKNTALITLNCSKNQLTTLDVSRNAALTWLECGSNQLTTLDVSRNTALTRLDCSGNQIKGEEMTRLVNSLPDRTGRLAGTFTVVQEPAPEGNICLKSDVAIAKSKNWNTQKYDSDTEEYDAYEGSPYIISFTTAKAVGEEITFYMEYSGDAPTLSGATGTPKSGGYVTYTLTSQTVTIRGDVTHLNCSKNQLTALDVSKNTELTVLYCDNNQLTALDVSQNTELKGFWCYNNQLTALDVSKNTALQTLNCYNNQLKALDVSKNTVLRGLYCEENQLTTLDVSKNTILIELYCYGNQIKGEKMTRLVNSLPDRSGREAGTFTVVQEPDLEGNICLKSDVAIAKGKNWVTQEYDSDYNEYFAYEGAKLIISFTTKKAVGEKISLYMAYSGDAPTLSGATGTPESEKYVTYTLTSQTVTITGDVIYFLCSKNQLTTLDVSRNAALTWLECGSNQLTTLDVSKNTALIILECYDNQLTALDVSQNTALTELFCNKNQLTALDVSQNTALIRLGCSNNQLKALDVSKNTALTRLYCFGNQIKGEEMTRLVNSLPDRTGKDAGKITVVQEPALEGNICLKSDVAIAKGKNWDTQKYKTDTEEYVAYEGAEKAQPFMIKLTKEGEGTLTATGATDLNAVPLGTELTIEATPADGYELKALTANGTDILAAKKFTVRANTEVKATFTKKTYAVTLSKEGEGTITATGAEDLNAVLYGTELTIEATPAAGYELTALTANGADILATKKFTVTADTEVKAIFAKTYAVTLTKEGEGTLTATGSADLNAVPEGTELTIEATPADGHELKALTANGTDILATKKFTVTADTEVKATFTKKTAADVVNGSSVRLYPNPASTYVNVKATKANALVRLYDANGSLRYEARTDADGTLQIDLSAYAEGTYLLRVGNDAQRLLIQR